MDPSAQYLKWKITCLVFHILTMIITSIPRLRRRFRPQEDSWAFAALFCDLGYLITVSLGHSADYSSEQSNPALFWASTVFFSFEVCAARICLFASILRLLPEQERSQQALRYATYAFGLFGCLSLTLKSLLCAMSSHPWPVSRVMQCHTGGGILFLSINLVYDSCFIGISVHALPWSKLNQKLYKFLGATFFATILNPVVGTIYLVQLLRTDTSGDQDQDELISLIASTMALASLLLCNLVVIVSFIYRKQNNH
ncbi:hypothetical protein BDN72DRAFT_904050 [Pluteus cervinus]|uniref:Uncharacterized protein n=1 Tax=Pluteus cervinus TaxID=181527 RepID=A0ACD3A738_9AGAR|nr:hypothetical protein BDN72DRAFT_904050 [Pluteus cervinus]